MAAIAPPPAPVKPVPPAPPVVTRRAPTITRTPSDSGGSVGGKPPANGHGTGNGGQNGSGNSDGHDEPEGAFQPPKKRRSIWPLLLDLGLVMMLFGLIIVGRFLIPIGAVVFVVALTGWIREARSDFSGLSD